MGAYAALVSLSHTLHHILQPPPLNNIVVDREQIEYLRGKVDFLIDFLETYSSIRSQEIADLEMRIADAAYAAEDLIESDVVEQIQATGGENISTLLCEGIQTVLGEFLSIEKELMKIKDKKGKEYGLPKNSTTLTTSSRPLPSEKITMVGFDEHVKKIMEALATDETNRQIIPILGMGGIGKTTLATAVYNNPFITEHFHVRAWVTVSQEYTVGVLLLRILSEITKAGQNKQGSTDDDEIGELVYKELFDRKYLIVMDDMWDIRVWDKVKRFFPHNKNGSRILVTTRLSNLADDFRSCSPYQIGLLDEEKSWELLHGKAFGKEDCPDELEETGKNIAKKCRGLPLALVVIGGFLAKFERTKEHWGSVEGDVTSAINDGNDEQNAMEILSLSYRHSPIYLKPCFLYLAMFPEDFEIRVTPLVRLWVAEGIIKPTPAKCLEEVAHEYLEDLISRNLIMVHQRGSSGKVKSCKIHDIVRELCIKEAVKEKFIYSAKLDNPNIPPNVETKRRLSISCPSGRLEETVIEALQSARFNRSLLCYVNLLRSMGLFSKVRELANKIVHGFRLLKVVQVKDGAISIDILKLNSLRYVVATSVSSISRMFLCWNLQTLVFDGEDITLPVEIWQMPHLRHLKMKGITLPDPPPPDDQNVIVLKNLQTLKGIQDFKCTEEVLKRIPNLKKLRIAYADPTWVGYYLKNLVCFKKLESLGIECGGELWRDIGFPISLKKLSLEGCDIPWEDLSIVGSLPNLEVLKLYLEATKGEEWNPIEGEFLRLKFLSIWGSELKIWRADNSHYPCLECLVLAIAHNLKEIPMSFAEILTLQVIQIFSLEDSLRTSARVISDERELLGYEPLQIRDYDPSNYLDRNFRS